MARPKLESINISAAKGTPKKPVRKAKITLEGLDGDAHAGRWHRQISLLSVEEIERFAEKSGRRISPGGFAENLTVSGIDLSDVMLWDRFWIGNVLLEVTQIGKNCHGGKCSIFNAVGDCIMPGSGIFARVLKAGNISRGDPIRHVKGWLRAAIIVSSDRASRGEYEDMSGPLIMKLLRQYAGSGRFRLKCSAEVVPDDSKAVMKALETSLEDGADIIITSGGTGIGPRDITVDVVKRLLDKEIPGIMEMIRLKHGARNPNALLSRSVAGTIGRTLVFSLPGSPRAAQEYLEEISKVLVHCLFMVRGISVH